MTGGLPRSWCQNDLCVDCAFYRCAHFIASSLFCHADLLFLTRSTMRVIQERADDS